MKIEFKNFKKDKTVKKSFSKKYTTLQQYKNCCIADQINLKNLFLKFKSYYLN